MAVTNRKYVFEVIDLASKAKTRQEKIDILRANETWALKDVLRGTYDDTIEFLLPDCEPPYEPADPSSVPSNLIRRNKEFAYFVKNGKGAKLPAVKREGMFIRLLEAIHPEDAKLLVKMICKKQLAKTITKKLVQEAYPQLIQERSPNNNN